MASSMVRESPVDHWRRHFRNNLCELHPVYVKYVNVIQCIEYCFGFQNLKNCYFIGRILGISFQC